MNNKVFGVRLSWSKLLHMTNTQDVNKRQNLNYRATIH